MGSPSSSDLRECVVKIVSERASRRQAAKRFGGSPASAVRWQESPEREGRVAAKPQGDDRCSQHGKARADLIPSLREERPMPIPSEPRARPAERGIAARARPVALLPAAQHHARDTRSRPKGSGGRA